MPAEEQRSVPEIEDSEDSYSGSDSEDMEEVEYMDESSDEEGEVADFAANQFFLQLTNMIPSGSSPQPPLSPYLLTFAQRPLTQEAVTAPVPLEAPQVSLGGRMSLITAYAV